MCCRYVEVRPNNTDVEVVLANAYICLPESQWDYDALAATGPGRGGGDGGAGAGPAVVVHADVTLTQQWRGMPQVKKKGYFIFSLNIILRLWQCYEKIGTWGPEIYRRFPPGVFPAEISENCRFCSVLASHRPFLEREKRTNSCAQTEKFKGWYLSVSARVRLTQHHCSPNLTPRRPHKWSERSRWLDCKRICVRRALSENDHFHQFQLEKSPSTYKHTPPQVQDFSPAHAQLVFSPPCRTDVDT